jgi:hypothetical protein
MPLNNDYIVGLVDGEGSFTVYVRNLKDSSEKVRRTRIEPKFYVKLSGKDKKILDDLKKYFRCGNVYFQKDKRKNHADCYRYEVTSRKHLKKIIIPFFKRNKLKFPSKTKDFRIFCRIMDGIDKEKHLSDSGLVKLYNLKRLMH